MTCFYLQGHSKAHGSIFEDNLWKIIAMIKNSTSCGNGKQMYYNIFLGSNINIIILYYICGYAYVYTMPILCMLTCCHRTYNSLLVDMELWHIVQSAVNTSDQQGILHYLNHMMVHKMLHQLADKLCTESQWDMCNFYMNLCNNYTAHSHYQYSLCYYPCIYILYAYT